MTTKATAAMVSETMTANPSGGGYSTTAIVHPNPIISQVVGKNPRQVRTLAVPLTVPSDLENIAQWVCWRYAVRDGKTTKIPVNARTGGNAMTDTPSTWVDFETALTYYDRNPAYVSGVGLVLRGTDLVGVDLDHCIDDKGIIAPWALGYVRSFNTYTEVSPSGTGLRMFGFGVKPGKREKRGGVELYDHTSTRFLTFTGKHLPGTPLELRDVTAELAVVYADVFGPEPAPPVKREAQPVDVDDSALIALALKAKNGSKFAALWQGSTAGYPSPSEADLALCCNLAYWTGGDEKRIDGMFRQSGLMRDKWNDVHSGTGATYGAMTIDKALELTTKYYDPPQKPVQSHSEAQPGGVVVEDTPAVSIADVWRVLNKAIRHDAEHCDVCGTVRACMSIGGDKVKGFLRTFRCHKAACQDWQHYRAKELVVQSGLHLWPAHYVTVLDVAKYDKLVDRGLLRDEPDWLAVRDLFVFDTVFVASAFPINQTSIGLAWDALAPMVAERWLKRQPGSRLRDPKKTARAKRAAVACDAPVPAAVVASVPPEPETRIDYAFGLAAMPMADGFDLLDILAAAGATVDHKRRRWEYPLARHTEIAQIVTGWASLTGKAGGHYEINASGKATSTDASISNQPAQVDVLAGDLHPEAAAIARNMTARIVTNHGRRRE